MSFRDIQGVYSIVPYYPPLRKLLTLDQKIAPSPDKLSDHHAVAMESAGRVMITDMAASVHRTPT